MPKILAAILLIAGIASTSANAEEKKLVVIGSMDYAFKSLSLDVGAGQKMTAPLGTVNPNLILSYGDLYASLSYDGTVGSGTTTFFDNGLPGTLNMSRADTILSVGYRLIDPVSVFAGWLNGNIHALQTGIRDFGGGASNEWYVQDIQYGTQGPFLGASWSLAVGERSSLSFSAAYAKLAGTTNDATTSVSQGTTTSSDSFDVSGLSYGVTLSGELTGSLGYRVGIKNTRYRGSPTINTPTGIVEEYTSFFIGVSNYF